MRRILLEVLLFVVIMVVAGLMRFIDISVSPGYEWDEPIYTAISVRTLEVGYPNLKGEDNIFNTEVYLYHPPMDFYLKGIWYQPWGEANVAAGRVLSAIESMIGLIIAFLCLKEISGKKAAFIGMIFLAVDGWLVYTNRMNLIENGMMPWGLLGIWFYINATKTQKTFWYILAGALLAFAAVYKHTGIPFLLVPAVNLLMTRKDWKNHFLTFQTIFIVVLIYVVLMLSFWRNDFLFDTRVQIERSIGKIDSRGLNYGLSSVVQAIIQTYWVFLATVTSIVTIGLTVGYRLIQVVSRGHQPPNSVFLSWALLAFGFMATIALKAPHYLITVLVPAYMFIASEIGNWLDKAGGDRSKARRQWIVGGLVGLFVVASLFTWNVRFVQHTDNALLETYKFFETVPVSARVIADECIGPILQQPYFSLDRHQGEQALRDVNPEFVVLYYSLTQKLPENPVIDALLARSMLVRRISGFKETVDIYHVNLEIQTH